MAETLDTLKKYTGPFTGPQMDQIFYEILNYTSERYARGTANGAVVGPGGVGYQDNSKWYMEQSRTYMYSAQSAASSAAEEAATAAAQNVLAELNGSFVIDDGTGHLLYMPFELLNVSFTLQQTDGHLYVIYESE